ncbi:MAG: hypothetical protein GF346_08845 [Candidatus Eisenbacteria bacterium]|nr:hypothetical protein [Candidatus Latescibacterota bacterium]MBD3302540.1 hypothetical protein [Candidatus Eisenbacteria bacterium]
MMTGRTIRRLCGIAGASLLAGLALEAGGCATTPPPPPPPPRVEVRPVKPTPKAVWVPGHWKWRGRPKGYVWIHGHWKIR